MRACIPRLAVLIAMALAPAVDVRGQSRSVEAAVIEEPPTTERSPTSGRASLPLGPAAEVPRRTAGPMVEASQLDTFLLRDSKGNLVPVLGLPFEEFEQLLRAKKGLTPPQTPGYVLEKLSLVGTADQRNADLQVIVTIRVREEGWIRVPLQMPSAVVRQPARYEGPGEQFLTYDAAAGGYVCWLKGNDPRPHVVTLQISAAITGSGDEKRLAIAIPRATESSLRLTMADASVEASLAAGEGLVSSSAAGGRATISILGPAGDVQLAWRAGKELTAKGPTQLDASGEIAVRIESEHRIASDARLRVRSYGAPLETFRVQLPPGMELIQLPPTGGFTVSPLATTADDVASAREEAPRHVVEVRLDKPTTATTEILIRAQREADAAKTSLLAPARFEVVGATRQRGTIDFTVDGEWQLDWTEDKSVHRLDLTPDTAAARIVARFEYFQQPCGLGLKVSARPSRVSVEPMHMVFVDSRQVRIETLLKYRFRGARASGLLFELGEWSLDRLTPDALLDIPVVKSQSPGQVQVPFRAGIAPPTELELKLEAHRTLPGATERLALTFPRPLADIVAPATIAIFAADNVELTPQVAELVGLSPDSSVIRLPGRQQPPVVYRDLGGGEPAQFAARMRTLVRATTASAHARVRIDRQQAQVEQRLDYRVAHEPQRNFLLIAPRELVTGGNLQVWMNGEPLGVNPVTDGSTTDPLLTRLQFATPTDQIGAFQAEVRYSWPLRWDGPQPQPFALPLVLPVDEGEDQFAGQQVEFTLADGLQIEPDIEGQEELSRPTPVSGGPAHAFAWSSPTSVSRWTIEPSQGALATPITVTQLWVQTWLSPQGRQDRAAFRLRTLQETVRVKLPKGVRQLNVPTAIDGQEVPRTPRDPGVLVVSVPAAARGRECVLELSYALDPPESRLGFTSEELRPAEILDAGAPRRSYWQLVLPEANHLISPPRELAAEMTWSSDRWFPARRPVMDQRQLEAWIKASGQDPLPRGVNEYLFGTLGRWPTMRITTAHRRLVLSLASGGILAIGLLLLHVPRLRTPTTLLVAAVALAAGAIVAPDLAVLAGQGVVLGLAVTAAAAALAWGSAGRVLFPTPSVSLIISRPEESPSAQTATPRPERSSRVSSTAEAPRAPIMEARP